MNRFLSVQGAISSFSALPSSVNDRSSCTLLITIMTNTQGEITLVADSQTVVVSRATLRVGDSITAYYDGNTPTPLIFPPRYRAVAIVRDTMGRNSTLDFFNQRLISSNGALQLTLTRNTPIVLRNGLPYQRTPVNQNLLVIYGAVTRSIPGITTPDLVIVLCE